MINFKKLGFYFSLFTLGSLILALLLAIYLVQKQTRLPSKASLQKPVEIEKSSLWPNIPPFYPQEPPQIKMVAPFFAKSKDSVLISGLNFGQYPFESQVYFGKAAVPKENILHWSDTEIEVLAPSIAPSISSSPLSIKIIVNNQQSVWPFPFDLYNQETPVVFDFQTNEAAEFFPLITPSSSFKLKIFRSNAITNDIETEEYDIGKETSLAPLKKISGIISISLLDSLGNLLPFKPGINLINLFLQ